MNFFKSLVNNWFGSEERKKIQEQLTNLDRKIEGLIPKYQEEEFKYNPPFKSLRKVGDTTIVVMHDGKTYFSNEDVYNSLMYCLTEKEVEALVCPKVVEEKEEEIKIAKDNLAILKSNDDFVVEGDVVYWKGVHLAIPNVIVADFIENLEVQGISDGEDLEILQDQYNRLKLFWLKLANSPVKDRDNVLLWCKNNDVRISKTGNIIAYRRIVKWDEQNSKLNTFVQESWDKIRKNKKSPKNYRVCKIDGGDFTLLKEGPQEVKANEVIIYGNLAELKAVLCEEREQLYTSWHNKGKYTFKIGDVYKLEGEEADCNVGNCHSGGLHCGAKDFGFHGYGDTAVVVLINPSRAIYVPSKDSGKFRTTEMKIVCLNPSEGEHIDESLIEQADVEYNDYQIDELESVLKSKSFESLSIQENVPEVSLKDIRSIVDILKSKVVNV